MLGTDNAGHIHKLTDNAGQIHKFTDNAGHIHKLSTKLNELQSSCIVVMVPNP